MDQHGYGKYADRGAHRVVYEFLVGPIQKGLQLDHLCRVRACVNPAHLEPVTAKENTRRSIPYMKSMNRGITQCKRGHEFTTENTNILTEGWRQCRTCKKELDRQKWLREKEKKKDRF